MRPGKSKGGRRRLLPKDNTHIDMKNVHTDDMQIQQETGMDKKEHRYKYHMHNYTFFSEGKKFNFRVIRERAENKRNEKKSI